MVQIQPEIQRRHSQNTARMILNVNVQELLNMFEGLHLSAEAVEFIMQNAMIVSDLPAITQGSSDARMIFNVEPEQHDDTLDEDSDTDQKNTTVSSNTSDENFECATPSDPRNDTFYSESSDSTGEKKAKPSENQLKSIRKVLFP